MSQRENPGNINGNDLQSTILILYEVQILLGSHLSYHDKQASDFAFNSFIRNRICNVKNSRPFIVIRVLGKSIS